MSSPKPPLGGTAYVLASQALLSGFTKDRNPYKNGHKRLFKMTSATRLTSSLGGAIWREDMSTWVAELMRRRIVENLLDLSALCEVAGRAYLTPCNSVGDLKALHHRGCGLFVGAGGQATADAEQARIPPESRMSVLPVEGAKYDAVLILYNLDLLLGSGHVAELRRRSALFADGSLFLLGRKRSLELQGRLWKLQGYLARSQDNE